MCFSVFEIEIYCLLDHILYVNMLYICVECTVVSLFV